jgi:hypothetical protein
MILNLLLLDQGMCNIRGVVTCVGDGGAVSAS